MSRGGIRRGSRVQRLLLSGALDPQLRTRLIKEIVDGIGGAVLAGGASNWREWASTHRETTWRIGPLEWTR